MLRFRKPAGGPIHETVRPVSACLAPGGSTAQAGNLESLGQAVSDPD